MQEAKMKTIVYWNKVKKEWQIYEHAEKDPPFILEAYPCANFPRYFENISRETPQVYDLDIKHLGPYEGEI